MFAECLECKNCGYTYELNDYFYCEKCLGPLQIRYNYETLDNKLFKYSLKNREYNISRFREFLPVKDFVCNILPAGYTPLIKANNLGRKLGLKNLYIKNDIYNPTHSFKDRVVSIALSKSLELGFKEFACASTGNLANSVAAYSAACGVRSKVYIPINIEKQKIKINEIFNTKLELINGSYDGINRICTEECEGGLTGFANINLRPYYAEGSKTISYEIVEQLEWKVPDRIICPIASGSLFTKIGRGFDEWIELGIVNGCVPKMNGAQAKGCSPVANAFDTKSDIIPVKPDTITKSLSIGNPADGTYAIDLANKTNGYIDAVDDKEIISGIRLLAETTGILTEPAGGVTIAVLNKLSKEERISSEEVIIAIITGSGLKSLDLF